MKSLFLSAMDDLKADPAAGKGTATTLVTWTSGMASRIEDGAWRLVCDEMEGDGGYGLGPDPGILARGSLGACLIAGYVMWSLLEDVPLTGLRVTVEGDYNARAMFGLEAAPPGFAEVRYRVEVESPAPRDNVIAMLDKADRHSSILDVFARAVPLRRDVVISPPA